MYNQADLLAKMDERIDAVDRELMKLSSASINIGKLENVLNETREQVQHLNLHLGKMQSVAETYNKFLGFLIVILTMLVPIGFSAVGSIVSNNSTKLDTALKTDYELQRQLEATRYELNTLKTIVNEYTQKKHPSN